MAALDIALTWKIGLFCIGIVKSVLLDDGNNFIQAPCMEACNWAQMVPDPKSGGSSY